MNSVTPVLSASFTKLFNRNIDRTAGMLYNNNVGDSVTFSSARNRRYEKVSEKEIDASDNSVNIKKRKKMSTQPNKKGLNDILSMIDNALSKDNVDEYNSIMREVNHTIERNFDYSSEKTSKDSRFLDSLIYCLNEAPTRTNIEELVQNYRNNDNI